MRRTDLHLIGTRGFFPESRILKDNPRDLLRQVGTNESEMNFSEGLHGKQIFVEEDRRRDIHGKPPVNLQIESFDQSQFTSEQKETLRGEETFLGIRIERIDLNLRHEKSPDEALHSCNECTYLENVLRRRGVREEILEKEFCIRRQGEEIQQGLFIREREIDQMSGTGRIDQGLRISILRTAVRCTSFDASVASKVHLTRRFRSP